MGTIRHRSQRLSILSVPSLMSFSFGENSLQMHSFASILRIRKMPGLLSRRLRSPCALPILSNSCYSLPFAIGEDSLYVLGQDSVLSQRQVLELLPIAGSRRNGRN